MSLSIPSISPFPVFIFMEGKLIWKKYVIFLIVALENFTVPA